MRKSIQEVAFLTFILISIINFNVLWIILEMFYIIIDVRGAISFNLYRI